MGSEYPMRTDWHRVARGGYIKQMKMSPGRTNHTHPAGTLEIKRLVNDGAT
jgi:hypothetical protein